MVWTIFCINVLTIAISFKKRMILYALLNAFFLFLVTGQAFQIESDLTSQHTVDYLFNFISDVGFDLALRYVLGISCISMMLAVVSRGYRRYSERAPRYIFAPTTGFYLFLFSFLCLLSIILIFAVVGISDFLHSSRPGFQTGSTIFLVLLSLGLMPLLFKIIYKHRIGRGDLACFLVSFVVTGAMGRTSAIFYLLAILLAVYYERGWAKAPLTPKLIASFLGLGIAVALVFVVYGAIRGAQGAVTDSLGNIIDYIQEHPEKTVLSIEWNYRFDIEGMSGIAGAFTQYLSQPNSVHHDVGASWLLEGAIQWLPGVLKPFAKGISDLSADLNWYPYSIVATAAESFFMSFGWAGMFLYPIAVYFLAWYLPSRFQQIDLAPAATYISYIFMAWTMLFVHGPLVAWIALCFSYSLVSLIAWPFFRRHFSKVEVSHPTSNA